MAAQLPTSSELKFESSIISRIPVLSGTKNYPQWSIRVTSTLQTYSVMGIVDGTVTYTGLATAPTPQVPIPPENADQQKWKLLDKRLCGFIAVTINDNLQSHVHFDWADATCPSLAKALWDQLFRMFGTSGLSGKFNLFHKATRANVRAKHAPEDLNVLLSLFEQMTKAGLNLPEFFKAMFVLTRLPDDFFTMSSTLVQTTAEADFTVELVIQHILMEIDLRSSIRPLASRISSVQNEATANRTNVIKKGPPAVTQWQGQQQRSKPAPSQQQQNHHGSGGAQAPGSGQNKPKSNKQKKREAYLKRQKDKGKGKVNEVAANSFEGFINEVDSEMNFDHYEEYDEDDFVGRFIDHLDDSMDTLVGSSSNVASTSFSSMDTLFDTGMDMAGNKPF